MADEIKHLRGFGHALCGKRTKIYHSGITFAKSYAEVTCKSCKRTETYRSYLAGKFKEKPSEIAEKNNEEVK